MGWYALDLPDPDALAGTRAPSVTLLGADGTVLATYGDLHGRPLHFRDLPDTLVEAVIATEDRRFFSHAGADIVGILRAAWANLRAGKVVQGGSTITQQVAKNLFLTPERSIRRKVQEILLALWLERRLTKREIFAIYVNRVYFGAGTYGVDAAVRRYFDKPASDLTLAEAAMITGLLKAPSRYNPAADAPAARARAAEVLDNMVEAGFIDPETALAARAMPIDLTGNRPVGGDARYAADHALARAVDHVGPARRDLVVTTTIEPALQRLAQEALEAGLAAAKADGGPAQGALVSLAPDGAVLALVGGSDYRTTQFNRATQARRQPGSVFKLFVYLAALEAGMRPDDMAEDRPVSIEGWSPRNFGGGFRGAVTLRDAFARSINTVAAETAWRTGIARVVDAARRLGVKGSMPAVPSLALGATETTLLELAAAYATVANQGLAAWPHVIREIRTVSGDLLYRHDGAPTPRLIDGKVQADLAGMLEAAIAPGHRPGGGHRLARGRKDRHQPGTSGRVVHRVHAPDRRRGVGRQRRRRRHGRRHRRRAARADLGGLHDAGPARAAPARPGRRRAGRRRRQRRRRAGPESGRRPGRRRGRGQERSGQVGTPARLAG